MPREPQTQIGFSDLKELLETRGNAGTTTLKIEFNETVLDVFANVLNQTFNLSDEDAVTRDDVATLLYNDLMYSGQDAVANNAITKLNKEKYRAVEAQEKESFITDFKERDKGESLLANMIVFGVIGIAGGGIVGMALNSAIVWGVIVAASTFGGAGMTAVQNLKAKQTRSARAETSYQNHLKKVEKAQERLGEVAKSIFTLTEANKLTVKQLPQPKFM